MSWTVMSTFPGVTLCSLCWLFLLHKLMLLLNKLVHCSFLVLIFVKFHVISCLFYCQFNYFGIYVCTCNLILSLLSWMTALIFTLIFIYFVSLTFVIIYNNYFRFLNTLEYHLNFCAISDIYLWIVILLHCYFLCVPS